MSSRILIDAAHQEETRVAVVRGNRIEEFDFESASRSAQRGNIYLARVTRVEPSLQAAFVEYGGNRHGFLAFNEIHPDYYQIPHEDRQALIDEEAAEAGGDDDDDEVASADGEDGPEVEEVGAEDALEDADKGRRHTPNRRYKIQEVIKRRQILLVQVVKEERGTKGAALTTYISLAGRYCVLMPNTSRGGGVSRRIADVKDRKRLKKILNDLDVPSGMGCIIRTNGAERTKADIKRDYTYLIRLWDTIREQTLESVAPALIYEESDLIKRTIRDLYSPDIEEILVDGSDGYRAAKDMMKMLIPSHAKKVKQYKDPTPLLQRYQVERQLETMYSTTVSLKSGGYLVINPTEALVAIDVNSGKSTRERNVERTAYRTNMEAAEEVARQLRLRDLAGLIVIDFIDMEESRNNRSVERKIKESLKSDRARLQVGRISPFGLLEMSRQRLRPGMLEASTEVCPICEGAGTIRSTESTAIQIMRAIEDQAVKPGCVRVSVTMPTDVAVYILNNKRRDVSEFETRYDVVIDIHADAGMHRPHYTLAREGGTDEAPPPPPRQQRQSRSDDKDAEQGDGAPKNNRNKGRPQDKRQTAKDDDETEGEEGRSKRRRGRRGGRRRRKSRGGEDQAEQVSAQAKTGEEAQSIPDEQPVVTAGPVAENATEVTAEEVPAEQPVVTEDAFVAEGIVEPEPQSASEAEAKPETAAEEAPQEANLSEANGAEASGADAPAEPDAEPENAESEAESEAVTEASSGNGASSGDASSDTDSASESETNAETAPPPEPEEPKGPPRKGWWNKEL
ncbi:MAG: Rne/Rng family ribonuclease [Alphaproteobacteria bacterium]